MNVAKSVNESIDDAKSIDGKLGDWSKNMNEAESLVCVCKVADGSEEHEPRHNLQLFPMLL